MEAAVVAKTEEKKKRTHAALESLKKPMVARKVETGARAGMPLFLQRAVSSSAPQLVQRQMDGTEEEKESLQPKLTVGQQGDVYEREADRIADRVMGMPEPRVQRQSELEEPEEAELMQAKPLAAQFTPLIQRQFEEEEEETEPTPQPQPEEEETVQAKAVSGQNPKVSPALGARIQSQQRGGHRLPGTTRNFFEPRLGADFSGVRVHTDAEASGAARELKAQAFTVDRDIFFGTGRYAPDSSAGKRLLAHELTHVVQQRPAIQRQATASSTSPAPTATKEAAPSTEPSPVPKAKLSWWERSKKWAFEKALGIAGVDPKMVMGLINKAGPALGQIFRYPARFVNTLIAALRLGFTRFRQNIGTYLTAGIMGWIFGTLSSAGIEVPKKLTRQSFFGLGLQVLGITVEALKRRIAKRIGEQNVQRLEQAYGILSTFVKEGIGGLWKLVQNYLGGLKDMLINAIKDWVVTRIVVAAVTKVLSLFNPVSGLVTVIKALYDIIKFLIERASQIVALFSAIAGSMVELAWGKVGKAAKKIVEVLVRFLPVAISFMTSLLGLGGIGEKIQSIIKRLQVKVNKAIDQGINWIVRKAKGLWQKRKGGGKAAAEARHKRILKKLAQRFKRDDGPTKLSDKEWIAYKKQIAQKLEQKTNQKLEKGVKLSIQIQDIKGIKRIHYRMRIAPNMSEVEGNDESKTLSDEEIRKIATDAAQRQLDRDGGSGRLQSEIKGHMDSDKFGGKRVIRVHVHVYDQDGKNQGHYTVQVDPNSGEYEVEKDISFADSADEQKRTTRDKRRDQSKRAKAKKEKQGYEEEDFAGFEKAIKKSNKKKGKRKK